LVPEGRTRMPVWTKAGVTFQAKRTVWMEAGDEEVYNLPGNSKQ
jgi:hypothetical protein